MAYDNSNSGVLFRNDDKKTDKHPDYGGTLNVDGIDYFINGWIKEGKSGKFLSLAVRPKEKQQAKPKPQREPGSDFDEDGEDLPF